MTDVFTCVLVGRRFDKFGDIPDAVRVALRTNSHVSPTTRDAILSHLTSSACTLWSTPTAGMQLIRGEDIDQLVMEVWCMLHAAVRDVCSYYHAHVVMFIFSCSYHHVDVVMFMQSCHVVRFMLSCSYCNASYSHAMLSCSYHHAPHVIMLNCHVDLMLSSSYYHAPIIMLMLSC